MTDKEKLEKLKKLVDAMYYAAQHLTADASRLHKAMEEYHQFIINEYHKEEPVSNPIDFEKELYKAFGHVKDFTLGMRIAKRFYDMGKNNQEHVSDELEEACEQLAENARKHKAETSSPFFSQTDYKQGVMDGAKWQKQHLWKPADGDDLPIIDREVIALLDNGKVVFAHRPPEFWDGKDIVTGKVTRNYPKTYDKGGWNIPDVKWWLDCLMPKEIGL